MAVPFRGIFILKRRETRTAKTGNPFFSLEFVGHAAASARTPSMDPRTTKLSRQRTKAASRLSGKTEYYNDRFSPRPVAIEVIDAAEAETEGMLGSSSGTESEEEPGSICSTESTRSNNLQPAETVERVPNADRATIQNSSRGNQYAPRLSAWTARAHSPYGERACCALLPLYPQVDPDLAIAGVILHGIGKLVEYEGVTFRRR